MTLLYVGTPEDQNYVQHFSSCVGNYPAKAFFPRSVSSFLEIKTKCAAQKITQVVTSHPELLQKALAACPDYIPPPKNKKPSLDDYAGSYFQAGGLSILVLNPLIRLITVPSEKFLVKRFLTKITKPESWFPQTAFSWTAFNPATVEAIFNRWQAEASLVAIDIETYVNDPLRRMSMVGYTAYFPATHTSKSLVIPVTDMHSLAWIRKFNNLPQPKIFQNGMYDNSYFLRFNSPVHNYLFDTLNLFHCLYSELPKRLDFITAFAVKDIRYWKDDGKSGALQDQQQYNARDTWTTLNAFLSLMSEVPDYAIKNYLQEFPMVFPCLTCSLEGIAVDTAAFDKAKLETEKSCEESLRRVQTQVNNKLFNPNSPAQMKRLFHVLGCKDLPDTSAISQLKVEASSAFNGKIMDTVKTFKKKSKLLSTYLVPEKFWLGRVFYTLDPAGTATGRLASRESSFWCGLQIQNIPRGKEVKQFLKADKGWKLGEGDYAQSEARCVAYLSGDKKLLSLVNSDKDYHAWNAQEFFGVPYDKIVTTVDGKLVTSDKKLRDLSKRTNHGANYNMGAGVMLDTMGPKYVREAGRLLGLNKAWPLKKVCEFLLNRYALTYPTVKGLWYSSVISEIEMTGKLTSALGWTRFFFGKPSASKQALNEAIAHGPQNLSVAIINTVFYKIWWNQLYGKYKGLLRVKAQIHDSIFFQYREGAEWVPESIKKDMTMTVQVKAADRITRSMTIPVDMNAGETYWSDLK